MNTAYRALIICGCAWVSTAPNIVQAQERGPSALGEVAAARVAWADKRVATVCEPLRRSGEDGRAAMCRENAARVRRDALRDLDATGSIAPEPERPEVVTARRSGLALLRSFPSAGVGF